MRKLSPLLSAAIAAILAGAGVASVAPAVGAAGFRPVPPTRPAPPAVAVLASKDRVAGYPPFLTIQETELGKGGTKSGGIVTGADYGDATINAARPSQNDNGDDLSVGGTQASLLTFKLVAPVPNTDTPIEFAPVPNSGATITVYPLVSGTVCPYLAIGSFNETSVTYAQTQGRRPSIQRGGPAGPCVAVQAGNTAANLVKIDISRGLSGVIPRYGLVVSVWLQGPPGNNRVN
jgi:hypothetical protein